MRTYFQFNIRGNISKEILENEIIRLGLDHRIKKEAIAPENNLSEDQIVLYKYSSGNFTSDSLFDLIKEFGILKSLVSGQSKEWEVTISCSADCYDTDLHWFSIDRVFANFMKELNSDFVLRIHGEK